MTNRELDKGKGMHLLLTGLRASARALTLAHVKEPLFVVMDNAETAQYLYGDIKALSADVLFFPAAQKRRVTDEAAMIQRTETLTAISRQLSAISHPLIVIT